MIQNPQLKTSLTTSIRNIMRNQDKGLLTTSTRLLNAQVKKAEFKSEMEMHEAHLASTEGRSQLSKQVAGAKKTISTIDLLRKQKQMHKKMRQLSQSSAEKHEDEDSIERDDDAEPQHTIQNAVSMPVLPGLQQRPLTSTVDGADTDFGG